MYRSSTIFEDHANYACYLLARVLNHFVGSGVSLDTDTLGTGSPEQAPYTDNWSRLFNCIENWYLCRPEEMKAALSLGADTSHGSSPFQTLLFGTGLQVSSCIGTNDGVISDAFQYLVISSTTQQHYSCCRKSHVVWRGSRLVLHQMIQASCSSCRAIRH
jgi:hypothetical protein